MYIIAGLYRGQRLKTPKGAQTRPTASRLREALFNICQSYVAGARFLDLFAGSGAIGLEALSRGAHSVTFVDVSKEAIGCLQSNIDHLKVESHCRVLASSAYLALQKLAKQGQSFDIIYADPPYQTAPSSQEISESETAIRAIDLLGLLAPGGTLFIEEDKNFEPHLEGLKNLTLQDSRRMGGSVLQRYGRK